MSGWKREQAKNGVKPRQAQALRLDDLRAVLLAFNDKRGHPVADRDSALLLTAWVSSRRRSTLVKIKLADLTITDDVITIRLGVSKTDQTGARNETSVLPAGLHDLTCPVRAVGALLDYYVQVDGVDSVADLDPQTHLFRSMRSNGTTTDGLKRMDAGSVNNVVKRRVAAAGFDPQRFSAHSTRRGHVTTRVEAGQPLTDIMSTTGHCDVRSLSGYVAQRAATVSAQQVIALGL